MTLEKYKEAVAKIINKEMWPMQAAHTLQQIEEEFKKEK